MTSSRYFLIRKIAKNTIKWHNIYIVAETPPLFCRQAKGRWAMSILLGVVVVALVALAFASERAIRVLLVVIASLAFVACSGILVASEAASREITICSAEENQAGDWELVDVKGDRYLLPVRLLPGLSENQPDKNQPAAPSAMVVRLGWNIKQFTGGVKELASASYVDTSTTSGCPKVGR